jgi:hypothetical protein
MVCMCIDVDRCIVIYNKQMNKLKLILFQFKKNIKFQEDEEEEGDQIFRHSLPYPPPLANCPFDIGINL